MLLPCNLVLRGASHLYNPLRHTEHCRNTSHRSNQKLTTLSAMKLNRLGSSDLLVSEVCLGTMTWGMQNTEEQAHEQIDYAISRGINFIDTAEMYPVPTTDPKWKPGCTEEIIGSYISKHPNVRNKLIIASKVVGYGPSSRVVCARYPDKKFDKPYPPSRLDAKSVRDACHRSLERLQTEYIDLYQLHWTDRYTPFFGGREYRQQHEREAVPIRETLLALKMLLDEGKIKAYGLSNESTFGVCEFVRLADEIGMPRPASIQNQFCLLNRKFEGELAEACSPRNFNIGLLPWSILAGGTLTGKYNGKFDDDNLPLDDSLDDCRFVKLRPFLHRFVTKDARDITENYRIIAEKAGMSVATLAQAFCKSRWYIPSSIIGATSMEQLKENIDAFNVDLSPSVLQQIDDVHNKRFDVVLQKGSEKVYPFDNLAKRIGHRSTVCILPQWATIKDTL